MADPYERLKRFQQTTTQQTKPEPVASPAPSTPPEEPAKAAVRPLPQALLSIPGVVRGNQLETIIQERDESKQRFLTTIGVSEKANVSGAYGLREVRYGSRDLLFPASAIDGEGLVLQTRDETFTPIRAQDLLFIDTETTGLAGGTGTLPFLTGLGYFTAEGFTIRQYLMRDYDEEPAVMDEIEALFARFPAVASYNGKCFDLPLLQSRFLLNRKRVDLSTRPHVDLLYPARRLWSLCLPDCTLGTVEQHILGRTRADDIPGALIPYVYFDFLRGLRMSRMRQVLNHNAEDIYSLAMLTAKTCRLFCDPERECRHAAEWIGLARNAIASSAFEEAARFFETALRQSDISDALRGKTQKHLSLLYKRLNTWPQAAALWHEMTTTTEAVFARVELAKYFEHQQKGYETALQHTEAALRYLGIPPTQWDNTHPAASAIVDELRRRRQRLLTRLTRLFS